MTVAGKTTPYIVGLFVLAAVAILVGGIVLERTSDQIARHLGISGAVFGATVLAAVTSLPEVATGMAAIKLDDYELAISDIFGGNGFLPTLFLLASLLSGRAVLPTMPSSTLYLTALGILLTIVDIRSSCSLLEEIAGRERYQSPWLIRRVNQRIGCSERLGVPRQKYRQDGPLEHSTLSGQKFLTATIDLTIGGPESDYDASESELLYARPNEESDCALFSTGALFLINWEFILAHEDKGEWMEFAVFECSKCLLV